MSQKHENTECMTLLWVEDLVDKKKAVFMFPLFSNEQNILFLQSL